MDAIQSISSITSSPQPLGSGSIGTAGDSKSSSFDHVLTRMLDQTNDNLIKADETVKDFVNGNIDNPHEVMIRLEEAHLALQFTIQMRNKVVEAYQELMRMQM